MKCVKCGHEIMEGAAFCAHCGEKVSVGIQGEDKPIFQADVKGWLKSGRLSVFRDRVEFSTSSVQKTIYNYSGLVAVKKGLDNISFITEDGRAEFCPVNRKNIHEAFLYIEQASRPYIAERKRELLAQGISYSFVSSQGLSSGILNISDSEAQFRAKSGQSEVVPFQDVKSVQISHGIKSETLEFSLTDGRTKAFGVDKELEDELIAFVKKAIEPYIAARKEALLAKGIYFSCLSSYGSGSGTLELYEDRAEFTAKSGQSEAVFFQDVRIASLLGGMLELALTDGTSKSFGIERDIQEEALSFVRNAIQPYVLKRTVGFDTVFGIDEQIEVNEERGVFHILRQGGNEITQEHPLAALVKCKQMEGSASKSALGILAGAAKAVGVQDSLGAPDADNIIRYAGTELTIHTEQGIRTELVRFGDFALGMSRNNKKYDLYFAEISKIMEYLGKNCPECELVLLALPEPKKESEESTEGAVSGSTEIAKGTAEGSLEPVAAVGPVSEKDQLGIAKYIEGVSGFINSCATPMTIAIQGSGGSGRNGIMKMLFDSLKGRYPDDRMWIDARTLFHSNSEEPLSVFVGKHLISQLSSTDGAGSKDRAVRITKSLIELVTGIVASDSQVGRNLAEELFKDGSAIPSEKLVEVFRSLIKERACGSEDPNIHAGNLVHGALKEIGSGGGHASMGGGFIGKARLPEPGNYPEDYIRNLFLDAIMAKEAEDKINDGER